MSSSKATDILSSFKEALKPLKTERLRQVSMDGPNVNWKFIKLLLEDDDVNILDLGSCGLHVVHGAFQYGHKESKWKVNEFLRGIYWIFKDSPARRGAFTELTGQTSFPLKFCSIRWVESSKVAYKALTLFDDIKKYISHDKTKLPSSMSVRNVKNGVQDKLLKTKIAFFATVATSLQGFLTMFQSPAPMVPFLYKNLDILIRSLLERFIRKDVVNKKNISFFLKLDFNNKNYFLPLSSTDIGFRANKYLKESKVSEKEKLEFLNDCQQFLKAIVQKLFERSPLKYKVVKAISCFDPNILFSDEKLAKERFHALLQIFSDQNIISIEVADCSYIEFNNFTKDNGLRDHFKNYQHAIKTDNAMNLDVFYSNMFSSNSNYKHLFYIVKIVLILSHGNAVVESGFSINKNMLVENMHERSLIARRRVYDAIQKKNGIENILIDKKLKQFFKNAHFKYKSTLEADACLEEEERKNKLNRKRISSEIYQLEIKKTKISSGAQHETSNLERRIAELRKQL